MFQDVSMMLQTAESIVCCPKIGRTRILDSRVKFALYKRWHEESHIAPLSALCWSSYCLIYDRKGGRLLGRECFGDPVVSLLRVYVVSDQPQVGEMDCNKPKSPCSTLILCSVVCKGRVCSLTPLQPFHKRPFAKVTSISSRVFLLVSSSSQSHFFLE
jgi:hypothetical protein